MISRHIILSSSKLAAQAASPLTSTAAQSARSSITTLATRAVPRRALSSYGYGDSPTSSTATTSSASKTSDGSLSKADIAKILSAEHGLSAAQSDRILNTVFDTIVEAVSKNTTVQIGSFGKFQTITSPPRMYRNPATRGNIWKEEITRVKFKPFTNFKDCVNGKKS